MMWTWNELQDHIEDVVGAGATWQTVQDRTAPLTWEQAGDHPEQIGIVAPPATPAPPIVYPDLPDIGTSTPEGEIVYPDLPDIGTTTPPGPPIVWPNIPGLGVPGMPEVDPTGIGIGQDDRVTPPVAKITVAIPPGSVFSVQRSEDDGATWKYVRAASDQTANRVMSFYDWECPTDRTVYYRLVDDKGNLFSRDYVERFSLNGQGQSWITDAFNPRVGLPVKLRKLGPNVWGKEAFRQASWNQPVDETVILGSPDPIVSAGVRQRIGNFPIEIISDNAPALREFLFNTGILLLRGVPCDLIDAYCYVVIPDVVETHLGNPHSGLAVFTGMALRVKPPSAMLTIPWWSWDDMINHVTAQLGEGATWADVEEATHNVSWADVDNDPSLLGTTGIELRPTP